MERKGRNVLCKGEGQRPIEPEQRSLQGENLTLKPLVVGGGAGSENSGSWSTGAETGRDGKEKRRKKRQKEGERGKQNKQRKRGDGKRLGKEGTGKQRKERRGKEEKRGGPGRQISYLRENPPSPGLQKTPKEHLREGLAEVTCGHIGGRVWGENIQAAFPRGKVTEFTHMQEARLAPPKCLQALVPEKLQEQWSRRWQRG